MLTISKDLKLPIDATTNTFAILAKRGVGKTYLACVMAEEMLKAGQQIVAIDPVGSMWGLRSEFPVVIFGGEHQDLPLEEGAGEVVARAMVENRFPAVLDLSLFRKGQMMRFMTAFGETLYRLNREPLHLFMDEADAFAPQGRSGFGVEENRMLGAMEDIVRRGRKRGIGCSLVTQRPAVLNKNVLTQCESLFALRLVHPKDIDAVMEWVNVHADPKQASDMLKSLPTLEVGESWFWSPGWMGVMQRLRVRKRETFDSSATPRPGERPGKPKHLQPVDLDALGEAIKATVEKAKADDPRELRKQIAELKKELSGNRGGILSVPEEFRQTLADAEVELKLLRKAVKERENAIDRLQRQMTRAADHLRLAEHPALPPVPEPVNHAPPSQIPKFSDTRCIPNRHKSQPETANSEIGKGGMRRMMIALAQRPGLSSSQLGLRAGLSSKSGTFTTYLGKLRASNWITGDRNRLELTAVGLNALGEFEPLPTGRDLLNYWLRELGESGAARMLEALANAYPLGMTKELLGEAAGMNQSGTFTTYLGKLRRLELVEGRGELRASAELFE